MNFDAKMINYLAKLNEEQKWYLEKAIQYYDEKPEMKKYSFDEEYEPTTVSVSVNDNGQSDLESISNNDDNDNDDDKLYFKRYCAGWRWVTIDEPFSSKDILYPEQYKETYKSHGWDEENV